MPESTAPHPAARPRPAVGRQVRRWRNERGMTLAQVADASGLNLGYLSQIENDKASPSLESLAAIGGALEVPIAWFLMESAAPPRVVRSAERPAFRGEGGIGIAEVDGGIPRDLCIVEATMQPGERTGLHSHPGDEHHVVLSGRYRLTQGEHVVELGPGDYLLWDATIPHDAENIGAEPATMLIISARNPHGETSRPDPIAADAGTSGGAGRP